MIFKRTWLVCLIIYWIVFSFSCNPDQEPKPFEWPQPEAHEQVSVFFSLPSIGLEFIDSTSICQYPGIMNQELDRGGSSGFLYRVGLELDQNLGSIENVKINLHIRGLEEITNTYIPFETIMEICDNNPDQCFVRFSFFYQGQFYSNISYESIPYSMKLNDPNAFYEYAFVETEENILECFDNQLIQPVSFEYDGYLYTNDGLDSLEVENMKSEFVIFEFL